MGSNPDVCSSASIRIATSSGILLLSVGQNIVTHHVDRLAVPGEDKRYVLGRIGHPWRRRELRFTE